MQKNKFNIVCFLENDQGRDIEQLLGLIYYIEKTFDCVVDFDIKWNIHTIYKKKPDMVLLPNSVGSQFYFDICKYAHESGIKIFALVSEGNFRTDGSFNFWGYNSDNFFYEEYVCLWSQRTLDYLRNILPNATNQLALTGATGFDRYKIYKFKSKDEFILERNIKQYKKIIGYAGWAFGKLFNNQGREELLYWGKNDPNVFQWAEEQMLKVEAILKESIEKNPDVLFVLKKHPNEVNPSITYAYQNEMNRLLHYPNVIYLSDDSLNIHDLINLSDIWTAFESTTAMESWLLNDKKPTLFINPDPDFNRDPTFKGTSLVSSYNQLQNYIDEYFSTGAVLDFEEEKKQISRRELIKNTIGFGDGLNHLRAGILMEESLNKLTPGYTKKVNFKLKYFIRYYLVKIGQVFYNKKLFLSLPRFKKTIWIFEKHKMKNAPALRKKYKEYFNDFYQKNDLFNKVKDKTFREGLLNETKGSEIVK